MTDDKITKKSAGGEPRQKREEELESKLEDIRKTEEGDKYKILARQLNLPYSDLKSVPVDPDALSLLKEEEARTANIAIIYKKDSRVTAVATDPTNPSTKSVISKLKNDYQVDIILTNPQSLQKVLNRYQTIKRTEVFEIGAIELKEEELDKIQSEIQTIGDLKNKVTNVSTTKMLEVLVAGAIKIGASDIHFESEPERTRLRYRFDGVLNDVTLIDKSSYDKLLNRIKVLSKLKLNVHNAPQDGRFTIRQKTVSIEVRVSILPSEFGETIVMRLLDPRTIKAKLEDLGMREDLLKTVKEQLDRATGAILTTGPTGSGKTTSLYAFVLYLNSPGIKVITIEDPVEYHIEGISQTQVDAKKGYSFANGLRAIVRQDPDIVLVGEIRDRETADIALQAALTGHLVLSTIHTNDSAGTIPRLIDLGIQPQIIAPAINMAMAQRLVRKLCSACKTKEKTDRETLDKLRKTLEPLRKSLKLPKIDASLEIYFPKAGGCKECNELGYKGRIGVYEAFIITKEMEKLILKSPAISDVRDLAIAEGMITMLQDAYIKLMSGVTSLEEIKRVLG